MHFARSQERCHQRRLFLQQPTHTKDSPFTKSTMRHQSSRTISKSINEVDKVTSTKDKSKEGTRQGIDEPDFDFAVVKLNPDGVKAKFSHVKELESDLSSINHVRF